MYTYMIQSTRVVYFRHHDGLLLISIHVHFTIQTALLILGGINSNQRIGGAVAAQLFVVKNGGGFSCVHFTPDRIIKG